MMLRADEIKFERQWQPLFDKISFNLPAGTLLQIQGPNGCGKTTLLRILAGFIEPTFGALYWCDKSILSQRAEYQEQLMYLGHRNGLKAALTVLENLHLMSAMQQTHCSVKKMEQILEQIGLNPWRNQPTKCLSAGQQRRLSYARLLLLTKKLWILDEPTTSVDSEGQTIFIKMLAEHLKKGGVAIVATHLPIKIEANRMLLHMGVQNA